MKKIFVNVICAFILSKRKRRKLRCKLLGKENILSPNIPIIVGKGNKVIVVKNGKELDYTNLSVPNLQIEIYGDVKTMKKVSVYVCIGVAWLACCLFQVKNDNTFMVVVSAILAILFFALGIYVYHKKR